MHWRRFLVYNAAGGIFWAALVCSGTYFLGAGIRQVSTAVTCPGAGLGVVAAIALILYLRRHLKRLERVTERAYPGPPDAEPAAASGRL